MLVLEDAALAGEVAGGADDAGALRAVHDARHIVASADHRAAVEEELRAVVERVLDRIVVEILIDVVAAEVAAAEGLGLDRPGVFHPAALRRFGERRSR